MFVNGHIFLMTKSFNINIILISNKQGRGATKSSNGLKNTISQFTSRKINIETVVINDKFEAVRESQRPVHVKIVGLDEHEGNV